MSDKHLPTDPIRPTKPVKPPASIAAFYYPLMGGLNLASVLLVVIIGSLTTTIATTSLAAIGSLVMPGVVTFALWGLPPLLRLVSKSSRIRERLAAYLDLADMSDVSISDKLEVLYITLSTAVMALFLVASLV